jgi:hypothetical protein
MAIQRVNCCFACGAHYEEWGWMDLCDRRCYYTMSDLLYAYESYQVAIPDQRLVRYFTRNPDGGGHSFFPQRIFAYIAGRA